MHANDDDPIASDALRCPPEDLERIRAWLLVELTGDDVDHEALLRDLRACDARIAERLGTPTGPRPVPHRVS